MTSPTHPTEGERRRDAALSLVAAHRAARLWRAQLAMLLAMRCRPDQTGTSDDMTPPGVEHPGNAPWIGAAVRALAIAGLIVRDGTVVSARPSRHANEIKRWRLADPTNAEGAIARLSRLLAAMGPAPADVSGTLFDHIGAPAQQ